MLQRVLVGYCNERRLQFLSALSALSAVLFSEKINSSRQQRLVASFDNMLYLVLYLILYLQDPNKQVVRVYSVPANTFESDDDDDDQEDNTNTNQYDEEN